jgi:hypothetical protein
MDVNVKRSEARFYVNVIARNDDRATTSQPTRACDDFATDATAA